VGMTDCVELPPKKQQPCLCSAPGVIDSSLWSPSHASMARGSRVLSGCWRALPSSSFWRADGVGRQDSGRIA
jgi:hypothetical protein